MRRLSAVLALSLLFTGCSGGSGQTASSTSAATYRKLSAEEAYNTMSTQDVTVVDVRERSEYEEGHLANAILVPLGSIGTTPPDALPDLDATLLVYCRSGRRSKEASEKLLALGYQNVYDFGGINDWPYEVVTD